MGIPYEKLARQIAVCCAEVGVPFMRLFGVPKEVSDIVFDDGDTLLVLYAHYCPVAIGNFGFPIDARNLSPDEKRRFANGEVWYTPPQPTDSNFWQTKLVAMRDCWGSPKVINYDTHSIESVNQMREYVRNAKYLGNGLWRVKSGEQ